MSILFLYYLIKYCKILLPSKTIFAKIDMVDVLQYKNHITKGRWCIARIMQK
jgi:hypothetical protein